MDGWTLFVARHRSSVRSAIVAARGGPKLASKPPAYVVRKMGPGLAVGWLAGVDSRGSAVSERAPGAGGATYSVGSPPHCAV